jgi:hypothetical protein
MKKIILLIFLLLGIVKVQAQGLEEGLDLPTIMPKISADDESRTWQRTLLLNEGQFIKVKEINKERHQTIDAVQSMYPHEPEKRDLKVDEVERQYDAEFAAVLTEKQMKEYLELHGRTEEAPKEIIAVDGKSFNNQIQDIIHNALTHESDSVQLTEHTFPASDSLTPIQAPVVKELQSMDNTEQPIQETPDQNAIPQKPELNQADIKREE